MRDHNGDRIGMFADGELLWHSNESGDISFTPGVALLGVKGMTKSCTGFMTTTGLTLQQRSLKSIFSQVMQIAYTIRTLPRSGFRMPFAGRDTLPQ